MNFDYTLNLRLGKKEPLLVYGTTKYDHPIEPLTVLSSKFSEPQYPVMIKDWAASCLIVGVVQIISFGKKLPSTLFN